MKSKFLHGAVLESIILSTINEAPNTVKHGYGIRKSIQKQIGVLIAHSTLYPELARLENNKLIASKWKIMSGRMIKQYALTEKGKATLEANYVEIKIIMQHYLQNYDDTPLLINSRRDIH